MLIRKEDMPQGKWRVARYQPTLGPRIEDVFHATLDDALEAYAMEDSCAVFLAVSNPDLALCQHLSTLLVDAMGDFYRPVFEKLELKGFTKVPLPLEGKGHLIQ